jgi:hypothetical protein
MGRQHVLGADVVVGVLGSREGKPQDGSYDKLHDLVAGKLAATSYMAPFDAEARTPTGASGWTRDRVQHAVASAIAHDPDFAAQVRSLLVAMVPEPRKA